MLIHLQCIYNFWLLHAVIYQSWMFYNHFIVILYHFLVLTYWHSAPCQSLFSACFLHRRKSIPNGVQTQRNFLWIFFGPEDTRWVEEVPEGCPEGGTTHQGAPWGPGAWCLLCNLLLVDVVGPPSAEVCRIVGNFPQVNDLRFINPWEA